MRNVSPYAKFHKEEKKMTIKSVLKFIYDLLAFILATTVFTGLVAALGTVAIMLLLMLGQWIGIGVNILACVAMFFIYCKAWDVLAWVVCKIADKIERKMECE